MKPRFVCPPLAVGLGLGLLGIRQPVVAGELLTDPAFTRGVKVIAATNAQIVQGILQPRRGNGEPAWRLVQWSSRSTVAGAPAELLPSGGSRFASDTKAVTFGPPEGEERGVRLLMSGEREYGGRLRQPQEPWPHLLVEQEIARPPALAELAAAQFRIEFRLVRAQTNAPGPLEPWHCAQFQAFLIVQNRNRAGPGFGDFLWFGIPMYDSRYRQPVAHAARDTAGSEKFIYTPPGQVYTDHAAADGQWIALDRDLLPLIREGLGKAWQEGFLTKSRDLADFRLTGLNLGWELTGPLDVEMHFRDLSLAAIPSSEPPRN